MIYTVQQTNDIYFSHRAQHIRFVSLHILTSISFQSKSHRVVKSQFTSRRSYTSATQSDHLNNTSQHPGNKKRIIQLHCFPKEYLSIMSKNDKKNTKYSIKA